MTARADEKPGGVSSIELFFDLVFVFVITQVIQLVEHAHGAMDFLRALLVLVPIWWMYAGYAWLTNNVRVTWQMRLVLIAAMAGFLVMALAIPEVFGAGALTFGLSYLFVVVLHLGAFALKGQGAAAKAIFGVAPFNLGASALLIGAASAGRWTWWSYFDREDRRAADKLVAAEPEQRSRMGLLGYWYAHLALIAGIILIAAGIRQLLEGHPGMELLAGGMALFMLGDVFFRWVMGMRPIAVRSFGAAVALVLGFLGTRWGAQAALAAIAALAIAVIAVEQRLESRKG